MILSTGHDLGDRKETEEDKKANGATREIFSLSSIRRLQEGWKGVPAIIISPALPVIVIVLTNAQIAFQIAPPLRKQDPVPKMLSF